MRYFKPDSKEYISDFVPQDMNLIYKMKQNLDIDDEKTETLLAKTPFNIKGGEMTSGLSNTLSKMYNDKAQEIATNYHSQKLTPAQARVQIEALTNHFNQNPEVQTAKYDEELVPVASALRSNPLFGDYGISDGKDPQTGLWKQVQKPMTRSELQDAYKTYFPGNGFEELTPMLKSIMPNVLEGNTKIEGFDKNENSAVAVGKGLYRVSTSGGWKTVKLDEAKVRGEVHDWVEANWERNNYQHYIYGRKSGDFKTKKDWENYIVNQFVGSRNDISSSSDESMIPVKDPNAPAEEGNETVSVYKTPQTTIGGQEETDDFDIQKTGSLEPYTTEEADAIYKKWNTTPGGVGNAAVSAANEIATGKHRGGADYKDIGKMTGQNKTLLLSSLKLLNKGVYNKALKGKMSLGEKALFYPKVKEIKKMLNKTLLESSSVVDFTKEEYEKVNTSLFGEKEPKVKNLGTGNSGNTKFYSKSDGRMMSIDEIKNDFDENEEVRVSAEYTADNPFSFITNDESFVNAKQLFIAGKEFVLNGPDGYQTSGTNSNDNRKAYELVRMKNVSKIYNTKFALMPVVDNFYGVEVKHGFKPFDNSDRSKGEFIVYINGKEDAFPSPQKADQFILEEVNKMKKK